MKVDTTNIDIVIGLTFHAVHALRERWQMDLDHNGMITGVEVKAYLANLATRFEKPILMKVGNRVVNALALYSPELELLENNRTGAHPFRLRLFYFARTPNWFVSGSVLKLEDHLWPEAPALCSICVLDRNDDLRGIPVCNSQRLCNPGTLRAFRIRARSIVKRQGGINIVRGGASF